LFWHAHAAAPRCRRRCRCPPEPEPAPGGCWPCRRSSWLVELLVYGWWVCCLKKRLHNVLRTRAFGVLLRSGLVLWACAVVVRVVCAGAMCGWRCAFVGAGVVALGVYSTPPMFCALLSRAGGIGVGSYVCAGVVSNPSACTTICLPPRWCCCRNRST
jgi:hypothetical protein